MYLHTVGIHDRDCKYAHSGSMQYHDEWLRNARSYSTNTKCIYQHTVAWILPGS